MKQNEILPLEDFLPYRLNRLADAASRDFARIYRSRYGLTRPEWRLLATLGQYGTMTARDVAAHSAMHKTRVSRAVSALEQRRWLVRRQDEADRRLEHLALLPAGAAAYADLVPEARAFQSRLMEALAPEDRAAVMKGLKLLESLCGVG